MGGAPAEELVCGGVQEPQKDDVHILDIGCGNGKMLGYLQKKTKAHIYGFDYSEEAIRTAQALFHENAEFREGIIGQIEYPEETFDIIISMDTLYFAADMTAFVSCQLYTLKDYWFYVVVGVFVNFSNWFIWHFKPLLMRGCLLANWCV